MNATFILTFARLKSLFFWVSGTDPYLSRITIALIDSPKTVHRSGYATAAIRMTDLHDIVKRLADACGPIGEPLLTDPFELIVWENIAYLANDERRGKAMSRLRRNVGLSPEDILAASDEELSKAAESGILPAASVQKLQEAARVAIFEFEGNLEAVVDLPLNAAKRALRKFPGIGAPGADKILLFSRRRASLAPESNALRVLVRLGIIPEGRNYGATYRSAQLIATEQIGENFELLISARMLLRRHGQETCRRNGPDCDNCVLAEVCNYYGGDKLD